MRCSAFVATWIAAGLWACSSGLAAPPAEDVPRAKMPDLRPTYRQATIADLLVPTRVRSRPAAGAAGRERLDTAAAWGGGPMRLLVLGSAHDRRGRAWVKVRLHRRPNVASGWLPANRARLVRTPWRVVLSLRPRLIRVYRSGRLVRRFRAVIGAPTTPTPTGLFAIAEEIAQPSAGGFLGPWALHLTAHSNVLDNFGGGPGRVAIHGRGGASFLDPLGSARSHGCVRVDNRHILWLAHRLSAGVPVRVRP